MEIVGNSFAVGALLAWPGVIILMFHFLSLERALIWSILGGYMLLPQITELNFPGIPPLNKTTIPNVTAFLVIVVMAGRLPGLLPRGLVGRGLLLLLALSPAMTALGNLDPVRFGFQTIGGMLVFDGSNLVRSELPGMRLYDVASELVRQAMILMPFFLARHYLRSEAALREILRALVIGGLIYAVPMLIEIRLSPQLHTWVYGFFQHDFSQAMRAGGFRPFVFMPHGLWVAFFAFMTAMAGVAMAMSAAPEKRVNQWVIALVLIGLIPLTKTLGVIAYAALLIPALLFLGARLHLLFGAAVSLVVLAYPLARGLGYVPTGWLVRLVEGFNPERASSLAFRFDNEFLILLHTEERPLLGWGSWGRFRPHDPMTGDSGVIVDGQWIITIGQFGWLGYIALFGLLVLPLMALWWQGRRTHAAPVPVTVSALVLIYAANMIDLLPNATLVPLTLLIGGALLAYSEEMRAETDRRTALATPRRRPSALLGASGAAAAPGRAAIDPAARGLKVRRRSML